MVNNSMGLGDLINKVGVKPLSPREANRAEEPANSVSERTSKVFHNRGTRKGLRGFFSKLLSQYFWEPYKDTYTRAKGETNVKVDYSSSTIPKESLEYMRKFNVIDPDEMASGLTREYGQYLREMYDQALSDGNLPDPAIQEMIAKIILTTSGKPWVPTTLEDWAALDKMEFALTQKYFEFACDLFNSPGYQNMPFIAEMKDKFGLDWREKMVAETLSRKLAYTGDLGGKSIDLPIADENGHYVLQKCNITSFPLGENLPAYVIDPENKASSPWLAIRGTAFNLELDKAGYELRKGGFESVLADTYDPKSIGHCVVNYSMVMRKRVTLDGNVQQLTLTELIEKFEKEGRPLIVVGHSLGGNIANIIGIRFFHKIKQVYGDDPPAVCKKMQKLWEKRMDEAVKNSDNPAEARKLAERKIINFQCEGSMIPGGGLKVVGLNLAVTPDCYDKKKSTLHYHSLHLSTIDSTVTEVNNEKENAKHVRVMMERIRQFGGWLTSLKVCMSKQTHTPQWWSHRKLMSQTIKLDIDRYADYT